MVKRSLKGLAYDKVLLDLIKDEKAGEDYICPQEDKPILRELFRQINKKCKTNIKYLAEIDSLFIPGSGTIILEHIDKFSSETIKAYLFWQMVEDDVPEIEEILLNLYQNFKNSNEYGCQSAFVFVRYDNAFKKIRSKKAKTKLTELANDITDFYLLPLTIRKLARSKTPELKKIFMSYLLNAEKIKISNIKGIKQRSFNYAKREILFTAIEGIKYYPCQETIMCLNQFLNCEDKDISEAAQKSLKDLRKNIADGKN